MVILSIAMQTWAPQKVKIKQSEQAETLGIL